MKQEKSLSNQSELREIVAMVLKIATVSVLAVVFSVLSYTGPYGHAGLIFFLVSSSLMAFVCSLVRRYWILLIFLVSPAFVAIVFRPSLAIWPLFSIVLASTIVLAKVKSKSFCLIACSAVILCGALCSFAGEAAYAGDFSISSVISQVTKPFDSLRDTIAEIGEQMVNNGYEEYRFDEDLISNLFSQIALYAPAIAVCTAMISAWISVTLWSYLNKRFNFKEYVADWYVETNIISAAVYVLAFIAVFICSSFETDIMTVIGIAFGNLTSMLTPCFVAVGVRCGITRIKASPFRNMYFMCMVFSVLLLVFSPSICISIYSVIGLLDTFRKNKSEIKR